MSNTLKQKLNQIKNEKDTKIIPENIKLGVEILGVTGTLDSEVKLNIFTQTVEPINKNGLWLKQDLTPSEIITDDNVTLDPYWNIEKRSIIVSPPVTTIESNCVTVGNDIYFFGGNGNTKKLYKYDFITNTFIMKTDLPKDFWHGSPIVVGTDIYLFGFYNDSSVYKYDTLTDSYTQLNDMPRNGYGLFYYDISKAVLVNNKIYFFGSNANSDAGVKAMVYNIDNDIYSGLTNIPFNFNTGSVVSVGTDIYLFGGQSKNQYCYKYNTLQDSYTKMTDIPYNFYFGTAVAFNNCIYLFSSEADWNKVYEYNTDLDSYKQLDNIPESITYAQRPCATLYNNDIYLFINGKIDILSFPTKSYTNNSIVIENGNTYNTNLISTNVTNGLPYKFNTFYYYTTVNGLNEDLPAYYGNGIEWMGLRNAEPLSIELNFNTLEIIIGNTETLIATIKPTNIVDQTLTWESDDDTVATVLDGVITTVNVGTCTITAVTNNGLIATCEITVVNDTPIEPNTNYTINVDGDKETYDSTYGIS